MWNQIFTAENPMCYTGTGESGVKNETSLYYLISTVIKCVLKNGKILKK